VGRGESVSPFLREGLVLSDRVRRELAEIERDLQHDASLAAAFTRQPVPTTPAPATQKATVGGGPHRGGADHGHELRDLGQCRRRTDLRRGCGGHPWTGARAAQTFRGAHRISTVGTSSGSNEAIRPYFLLVTSLTARSAGVDGVRPQAGGAAPRCR
jgi:hypothetical protein